MILARHADALFWAGRQLERAESTTRALDVVGRNAMHQRDGATNADWLTLLALFSVQLPADAAGVDRDTAVDLLFGAAENDGSVLTSVRQLRENIRTVRDRVPVELWEEANRLHLELQAAAVADRLTQTPFEVFTSMRRGCQTLAGVAAEAMPRDETYTFFDAGRMLERGIGSCRLARAALARDGLESTVLLRVASTLQSYRREWGYDDDPIRIASFLLTAERVPRSVLSCLRRIETDLATLPDLGPGVAAARRLCGRARSLLEFGDVVGELASGGNAVANRAEHELATLSDVIATYALNPTHSPVLHSQYVRPGTDRP